MVKETDETISYLALLFRPLQDAFLNGTLTDEPVDGDLLCLSQSVGAVHRLLVNCRIPVAVIEDHLEFNTYGLLVLVWSPWCRGKADGESRGMRIVDEGVYNSQQFTKS